MNQVEKCQLNENKIKTNLIDAIAEVSCFAENNDEQKIIFDLDKIKKHFKNKNLSINELEELLYNYQQRQDEKLKDEWKNHTFVYYYKELCEPDGKTGLYFSRKKEINREILESMTLEQKQDFMRNIIEYRYHVHLDDFALTCLGIFDKVKIALAKG